MANTKKTAPLPAAIEKHLAALEKTTPSARRTAEHALRSSWSDGAPPADPGAVASRLLGVAHDGTNGRAEALRLLGDGASLGGPIEHAFRAAIADGADGIAELLGDEDAEVRAGVAYVLAHAPASAALRKKLSAARGKEKRPNVRASMTYAGGLLAARAGEPFAPRDAKTAVVRAANVVASLISGRATLAPEDEAELEAGILASDLDATTFPFRRGAIDEVIRDAVAGALGPAVASRILVACAQKSPEHPKSTAWRTPVAEHARPAQEPARPATPEPEAEEPTSEALLTRMVSTPKGKEPLYRVLDRFEKNDATFDERHAFLATVLEPNEHLEVARLAADQVMGLQDLGDVQVIAFAKNHAASAGAWARWTIERARADETPRSGGDFWTTLALYIELKNGTRRTIEPELDKAILVDPRRGEISDPVLAALPADRRKALLAGRSGRPSPRTTAP